jgi:hypothetical protein
VCAIFYNSITSVTRIGYKYYLYEVNQVKSSQARYCNNYGLRYSTYITLVIEKTSFVMHYLSPLPHCFTFTRTPFGQLNYVTRSFHKLFAFSFVRAFNSKSISNSLTSPHLTLHWPKLLHYYL